MHIILQAHILSYSQDEEDIQNRDIWRKGQGSSSPKKYFLKVNLQRFQRRISNTLLTHIAGQVLMNLHLTDIGVKMA